MAQKEILTSKEQYHIKESEYFAHLRMDLINLIPKTNPLPKVLEFGAAGGNSLIYMKQNKIAAECVGVELFDLPDSNQKNPLIDKMIIADIEKDKLDLSENFFDVILCGDVLEHLVNPWLALDNITKFLKPGGIIIISTPNFRHISALKQVVFKGDFKYQTSGVLDKTHMRFFCKKNIIELANVGKLKMTNIYSSLDLQKLPKDNLYNKLTLGLFKDFFTPQYITVSIKQ